MSGYSPEASQTVFRQAIQQRMQGEHPLTCYLSGGIDSSLVAAYANEFVDHKLDTYTVSFKDNDEEATKATVVSDHLKLNNEKLYITGQALADHFEDTIYSAETFGFNADELFGGYSFSVLDSIRSENRHLVAVESQ